MERTMRTSSKPIDIVNNSNVEQSYTTFITENEFIQQDTPTYSPIITPNGSVSPHMKKTLSLDNLWPYTPPSFSPNKSMLTKLKELFSKNTYNI